MPNKRPPGLKGYIPRGEGERILRDVILKPTFLSYDSGEQTISTAGVLTLTHGLGGAPDLVVFSFKCKTAEGGYSIGDEIQVPLSQLTSTGAAERGATVRVTTTQLVVQMGNATAVFYAHRKSPDANPGNGFTLTNGSWKIIVRAWKFL